MFVHFVLTQAAMRYSPFFFFFFFFGGGGGWERIERVVFSSAPIACPDIGSPATFPSPARIS